MAWILVLLAGLLETTWIVSLRFSEGFTRLWPSVLTVAAMASSMALVSQAIRWLPVGTTYAVWTGIGVSGAALVGILFLKESAEPLRLACLGMIVVGVMGLRLVSSSAAG